MLKRSRLFRKLLVTVVLTLTQLSGVMSSHQALSNDSPSDLEIKIAEIQKELDQMRTKLNQEVDQASQERTKAKIKALMETLSAAVSELKDASSEKAIQARKQLGEWIKETGEKISNGE